MDRFAVDLRKDLWDLIDKIVGDCRQLYVKDPCRDFTRKRKLPMEKMLKLLILLQAKSLPHAEYSCSYPGEIKGSSRR